MPLSSGPRHCPLCSPQPPAEHAPCLQQMCPLNGPAPCSSPPDVHPLPHRWVSAKPSRNAFCIGHSRAPEAEDGSWGGGATSVPSSGHCTARETMPTSARRGRTSRRGHFPPGLAPRLGHPVLTPGGVRRVLPSRPAPVRDGPTSCRRAAWGALALSARPSPALALSPRPPGRIPGRRRAEAGPAATAGSPLIVRGGGGGGGGGGGAPEPRQDVAEAVVAVQLGLALGALDGALEAAAEEALRAGRQEGEGRRG